jgi:hypothetical protein
MISWMRLNVRHSAPRAGDSSDAFVGKDLHIRDGGASMLPNVVRVLAPNQAFGYLTFSFQPCGLDARFFVTEPIHQRSVRSPGRAPLSKIIGAKPVPALFSPPKIEDHVGRLGAVAARTSGILQRVLSRVTTPPAALPCMCAGHAVTREIVR